VGTGVLFLQRTNQGSLHLEGVNLDDILGLFDELLLLCLRDILIHGSGLKGEQKDQ
jgi:hypothetical protein